MLLFYKDAAFLGMLLQDVVRTPLHISSQRLHSRQHLYCSSDSWGTITYNCVSASISVSISRHVSPRVKHNCHHLCQQMAIRRERALDVRQDSPWLLQHRGSLYRSSWPGKGTCSFYNDQYTVQPTVTTLRHASQNSYCRCCSVCRHYNSTSLFTVSCQGLG